MSKPLSAANWFRNSPPEHKGRKRKSAPAPGSDEVFRFEKWYQAWRGVFANEAQARVMFDEAATDKESLTDRIDASTFVAAGAENCALIGFGFDAHPVKNALPRQMNAKIRRASANCLGVNFIDVRPYPGKPSTRSLRVGASLRPRLRPRPAKENDP